MCVLYIHFSFYFQQTCDYNSECLEHRSSDVAYCVPTNHVCSDKVTLSDADGICDGCIALCLDRRAGRNEDYAYHCCDCPPPPPPRRCFPSTAKVSLENGISVKMSELQVGDHVQIGIHILVLVFYLIYLPLHLSYAWKVANFHVYQPFTHLCRHIHSPSYKRTLQTTFYPSIL